MSSNEGEHHGHQEHKAEEERQHQLNQESIANNAINWQQQQQSRFNILNNHQGGSQQQAATAAAIRAQAMQIEDNIRAARAAGAGGAGTSGNNANQAGGGGFPQGSQAGGAPGGGASNQNYLNLVQAHQHAHALNNSPDQLLRQVRSAGRFPGHVSMMGGPGTANANLNVGANRNQNDLLMFGSALEREAALFAARLRQNQQLSGLSAGGGTGSNNPFLSSSSGSAGHPALSSLHNPLGSPIPNASFSGDAFSSSLESQIRMAQLMALQSQQQPSTAQQQLLQHQQQLDRVTGNMAISLASSNANGPNANGNPNANVANWFQQQQQQQATDGMEESFNSRSRDAPLGNPPASPISRESRVRKATPASPSQRQQPPTKKKRSKAASASSFSTALSTAKAAADAAARSHTPPQETSLEVPGALPPVLPPAVVGAPTPHYSEREHISLATDEDQNWLSEFQCFIRAEILEVFRASDEDVRVRNNSKHLVTQQVGVRCRFCAHLPPSARASRSSAFPSSVPQIYQSFTMMLRDHWPSCQSIPSPQQQKFVDFKTKNNQGASDSKNYWMHAARRIGMVNTSQGIEIDNASRSAASLIPPFGHNSATVASLRQEKDDATVPLVLPEDQDLLQGHPLGDYWYFLLTHVQRVRLSATERVGNRKSLRLGLPGFGCRYCAKVGRLGLSRIFPARRRTLPSKIPDLHDHLRRCTLCPADVKEKLREFEEHQNNQSSGGDGDDAGAVEGASSDEAKKPAAWEATDGGAAAASTPASASGKEREFFTRIWSRLGHGDRPEPS